MKFQFFVKGLLLLFRIMYMDDDCDCDAGVLLSSSSMLTTACHGDGNGDNNNVLLCKSSYIHTPICHLLQLKNL